MYAGSSGLMSVSTACCLPFCESIQSSVGEVTGQHKAKKQCEPGEDASCISLHLLNGLHGLHSLHSLHARLHSTPHDQTSAWCGRWAAEASQEAACLLTIVGAAVEQANPGKRDYRAGSERPRNRKMKRPIVPRQAGRQQRNHQPSPAPLAAPCTP